MKIVYLIAGTYRPAGMERVLALKANHFASNGDEVLIVTTDQRGRESAFRLDPSIRTVDLGIDYELTNGRSFLVKTLQYPFKKLRHRRLLSALLRKDKADVVVSMFCNDASFVPSIKDGSRKILEVHFSRFKLLQYGRRGLWAIADKLRSRNLGKIASRYDSFVVLTEEDRLYWLEEFPNLKDKIRVIPNPRTFEPSDFSVEGRTKTVLAAGRYCEQKNFSDLVKAWNLIPEAVRSGWKLRIAGDGPLRAELERISDGSVILGPASDMKAEYGKASIFALTSRYEGLPMVLLEAQAAGLPIVSYECKCGPRDVLADGSDGYLVPEGDVEGFAGKLAYLISSQELRSAMGDAALTASEHFASEMILSKWNSLLYNTRTIVVSAVNLRKGGTLEILRQTLSYLSSRSRSEPLRVIALVHRKDLCEYPGIEYVEMPWCVKSWFHRLWAEYVTMYRMSKAFAAQRGGAPVDVWLSLHDTTPRVLARRREVYCHTSFPFLKVRARDFLMDPKIPLFALLTKFAYRINVRKNDSIIVQQNWFADALSKMLGVPRDRFRVIPPRSASCEAAGPMALSDQATFLFVSTPDCHKNFETLLEASRMLEEEGARFKVVITVAGDENRYAKWLKRRWGKVKSVEFKGRVSREDIWKLYREAGVFVFPSRIETWGLPISEYAAANPDGKMLLADLPYAHETSVGFGNVRYFRPTDAVRLKKLMYESIAVR